MRCKSKSFSLLIILILAVSSLIMVEPACAWTSSTTRPFPAMVIVGFNSPQNETYSTDSLTLNVTLEVNPASGNERGLIAYAYYILDDQQEVSAVSIPLFYQGIQQSHTGSNFENIPYAVTFGVINLPPLSDGEHNIYVFAGSEPYTAVPPSIGNNGSLNGHATISFEVITTLATPSPSPTPSPTLTPAPTPTPTITGSFTEKNATLFGAIIIVAVIGIGAGLLVYFKKHKH